MTAQSMYNSNLFGKVNVKDLKVGDLLFFDTGMKSKVGHVGVFVGDGMMIHASSAKGKAVKIKLSQYWFDRYLGARRIK